MKKRYIQAVFIIHLLGLLLFACKKESDQIIPETDVFVSISGSGSLQNTVTLSVGSATPPKGRTLKIGAVLTKASAKDILATVAVDTTLAQSYKSTYNVTQYGTLPATAYKLTYPAKGLTIKAGSDHSIDSLQLDITDISQLDLANYILPIRITSVGGNPDAVLSPLVSTVYVRILVEDNREVQLELTGATNPKQTIEVILTARNLPASDLQRKIGIIASLPVATDIRCTVVANTQLVQSYNTAHSVAYKELPSAAYRLVGIPTLKAGTTSSVDSLFVDITDASLLDKNSEYLLPIQLQRTVPSKNVILTPELTTVYLHVSINSSNIATSGTLEGTVIDRTNPAWTVTASSSTEDSGYDFTPPNVLDNDPATDWISDYMVDEAYLQMDMGMLHTLKGINIEASLGFGVDVTPAQITVTTSKDGIHWDKQGVYMTGDYNPGTTERSIIFLDPVEARYFKLDFELFGGFSEINAVE